MIQMLIQGLWSVQSRLFGHGLQKYTFILSFKYLSGPVLSFLCLSKGVETLFLHMYLCLRARELSPLRHNLQHSSSRSQKFKLTEWRPTRSRRVSDADRVADRIPLNVFVGGVRVQVGGPRTNTEDAETGPKATAEWRETQAGFQSRVICLKPSAQV